MNQKNTKVATILALFALNTAGVIMADKALGNVDNAQRNAEETSTLVALSGVTELSQAQAEQKSLRELDPVDPAVYHRDSECSYAGKYSACEPEIISSHYDQAGNLHEVVIITDKQGHETTRQVMYKPVGFVPVGAGDENYN